MRSVSIHSVIGITTIKQDMLHIVRGDTVQNNKFLGEIQLLVNLYGIDEWKGDLLVVLEALQTDNDLCAFNGI